ncbi:hypothetical protein HZC21_00800 [Candidatus Peregrinibacteria bacterium]|nr:hypothetical protein [Candidatus Peregrinibacteria bacterium]
MPWDSTSDLCDLSKPHAQHELYLISKDAKEKTIISRERIGTDEAGKPIYTLSWLKMDGEDSDGDKVIDKFKCNDFFCTGGNSDCSKQDLPASRENELNPPDSKFNAEPCETKETMFGKDFVPILPLNISVTRFDVYISPAENPYYAFAEESVNSQPYMSIVLTLELNQQKTAVNKKMFNPITLVETVSPKISANIPAPLLYE